MLYDVRHVTTFDYSAPVTLSHHRLHLAPRPTPWQAVLSTRLRTRPSALLAESTTDAFGNPVAYLSVEASHSQLAIEAHSRVELTSRPHVERNRTPPWEHVTALIDELSDGLDVVEFIFESPATRVETDLLDYVLPSFTPGRPFLDAARDLISRIHADFVYDGSATDVTTSVDEAFAQRRGVCQDFAHVAIACVRRLGLPARYVSGYLRTRPAPGRRKLRGVDASHAWLSVFCPGSGWVDLDPTNDVLPRLDHVTLAWGRDYTDVSPVLGVLIGGDAHVVKVAVDVDEVEDAVAASI